MDIRRHHSQDTVRVLIGMITDKIVAQKIADRWDGTIAFKSKWANIVAKWAIDHVRKYQKPIGQAIERAYDRWALNRADDDKTVADVGKFLRYLDEQHDQDRNLAPQLVVDVARSLFDHNRLADLLDAVEADLEIDRVQEALEQVNQIRPVRLGDTGYLNMRTRDEWQQLIDDEEVNSLISYHGDFGDLIGGDFSRDCFVAYLAPDKTGKSFFLMDAMVRAIRKRRRVAYFEAGDLSRKQVDRRLISRLTGRPYKYNTVCEIPKGWEKDQLVMTSERLRAWTADEADVVINKYYKRFRQWDSATGILSIADIESELQTCILDGWIPDVIVIDYADLLADPVGFDNRIDAVTENWKNLRRISTQLQSLVLTATQGNAGLYKQGKTPSRQNFSQAKGKLAHVTGMLGLVQNTTDPACVRRVNWIVRREAEFSENRQVRVAGCLALACPIMVSQYDFKGKRDEN